MSNFTNNLTVDNNLCGWYVTDTSGQRWWPDTEAADEIAASDDPAATTLRICTTEPDRGEWLC